MSENVAGLGDVSSVDSVQCVWVCVCVKVEQTVHVAWFNCTSSMLMNVQPDVVETAQDVSELQVSRQMFHTCTRMTWSRRIIETRGEIHWNESKDSDLHAQRFCYSLTFYFFPFYFVSIILRLIRSSVFLISETLELHRTRREILQGGAPPQHQTGFSSTSGCWRGVNSLTEFDGDGESPCRLEEAVWCSVCSVTSDASQGSTVRGGIEA